MIPLLYLAIEVYVLATGDIEDLASGKYSVLNYLLTFVHIALMFYVLHFLTSDMADHDARWFDFVRRVKLSLARSGFMAGGLYPGSALERRSTLLFIVLSIVTVGVFVVYWWYAIVKDQNDHVSRQARFEKEFVKFVETQAEKTYA
jgi:hypothetical protein